MLDGEAARRRRLERGEERGGGGERRGSGGAAAGRRARAEDLCGPPPGERAPVPGAEAAAERHGEAQLREVGRGGGPEPVGLRVRGDDGHARVLRGVGARLGGGGGGEGGGARAGGGGGGGAVAGRGAGGGGVPGEPRRGLGDPAAGQRELPGREPHELARLQGLALRLAEELLGARGVKVLERRVREVSLCDLGRERERPPLELEAGGAGQGVKGRSGGVLLDAAVPSTDRATGHRGGGPGGGPRSERVGGRGGQEGGDGQGAHFGNVLSELAQLLCRRRFLRLEASGPVAGVEGAGSRGVAEGVAGAGELVVVVVVVEVEFFFLKFLCQISRMSQRGKKLFVFLLSLSSSLPLGLSLTCSLP